MGEGLRAPRHIVLRQIQSRFEIEEVRLTRRDDIE
jgi:hypothetical protein